MADRDLPHLPDRSTVLGALRVAARAPSVHNTQPWRWVSDRGALRLYRDDSRSLSIGDPSGRQLVISCGVMLHHARTVFAADGWHTDIERLPDPTRPDCLAALEFRPWPDPPPGIARRAHAIERRYSARGPMGAPPDWADLLHRLRLLASPHEVEVDVLDEAARPRLVAATEGAEALHRYDMRYQAELRWWSGHLRPEGESPRELSSTAVGRRFPPASAAPRADGDHAEVISLGTDGDAPRHWLRTGEALSAILLECTAAGAAGCALTHLTEVPAARRLVAGLTRLPHDPQVLVRVGTDDSPTVPRSPRRPVREFVEIL